MSSIKKIIKHHLNGRIKGRNIETKESDIFLVSYPKSGNTWMRFLLGNILYGNVNFINIENLIPDIYIINNRRLRQFSEPRIMKSHEYFDPRYKKVIYIVRDPRSVVVSYYHYHIKYKKIPETFLFSKYLDLFLSGRLDPFGSWKENVDSWLCTRCEDKDKFLILKYEELINNCYSTMCNVISFLNLDFHDKIIHESIEKSSFANMKNAEQKNKYNAKIFKGSDLKKAFIRSGSSDEWKNYFNQNDLRKLTLKYKETMHRLGYK